MVERIQSTARLLKYSRTSPMSRWGFSFVVSGPTTPHFEWNIKALQDQRMMLQVVDAQDLNVSQ